MGWHIRPAAPGDGRAIVAVQTAAWQIAYAELLPAERLAALGEPERQRRSAEMWDGLSARADEGAALLVAEVDGDVSGFAATSRADERDLGTAVFALNVFHLHPAQWGTGLAAALMTAAIGWMADVGGRRALLWTLRDATRARRFYEREGWYHDGATQTRLEKPLWRDLEIPQVRYLNDSIGA